MSESSNRIQFRLNPKKIKHKQAIEILNGSDKEPKEFIVDAILAYKEGAGEFDEERLRTVLREELSSLEIAHTAQTSILGSVRETELADSMAENTEIVEDEGKLEAAMSMFNAFNGMQE